MARVDIPASYAPQSHAMAVDPDLDDGAYRLWGVLHKLGWEHAEFEMEDLSALLRVSALTVHRRLKNLHACGWITYQLAPGAKMRLGSRLILHKEPIRRPGEPETSIKNDRSDKTSIKFDRGSETSIKFDTTSIKFDRSSIKFDRGEAEIAHQEAENFAPQISGQILDQPPPPTPSTEPTAATAASPPGGGGGVSGNPADHTEPPLAPTYPETVQFLTELPKGHRVTLAASCADIPLPIAQSAYREVKSAGARNVGGMLYALLQRYRSGAWRPAPNEPPPPAAAPDPAPVATPAPISAERRRQLAAAALHNRSP